MQNVFIDSCTHPQIGEYNVMRAFAPLIADLHGVLLHFVI